MLGHDHSARWTIRVVPDGTGARIRDAVAGWLTKHRRLVSVAVSVGVAAVLIGSDAVPKLLLPFVVGPVVAVILTALVTPSGTTKRVP